MGFLSFIISNIIYLIGVALAFGSFWIMADADTVGVGAGVFILGILITWYARYRRQQGL